jgi:hypothetical protein
MPKGRSAAFEAFPEQLAKAARRVGRGPDQQARWLLDFAWCALDDQAVALGWELEAFMWIGSQYEAWARGRPGHPAHRPPGWPCTLDELRHCQDLLREGLRSLVYEGIWPVRVPATTHVFRWSGLPHQRERIAWKLDWVPAEPHRLEKERPDSGFGLVRRDTAGLFAVRVYETLRDAGPRFRVCEREGCWKPFIARKRQAYCSRRCSQTVRTRKFRERDSERVRKLRRGAYERSVRARSGPNVKIATHRSPQRRRHELVGAPVAADSSETVWRPLWRVKPTHWWQPRGPRRREARPLG